MGRPKKQTVDFFPHMVSHKRTMFVLESKWGNHGYACWFKLLETLGSSEGHYFNCNQKENWDYLLVKTRLPPEIITEILDTLASLNAIDLELWKHKIIWSQNFVDGISGVYENRRREIPRKPDPNNTEFLPVETRKFPADPPFPPVETPRETPYLHVETPFLHLETPREGIYLHVETPLLPVETPFSAKMPLLPVESTQSIVEYTRAKHTCRNAAEPIVKALQQKTKPRNQQLADLAEMLRIEDPAEYKKLLEAHPELDVENIPWDKTTGGG